MGAIHSANNPSTTANSKHIDSRHHVVCMCVCLLGNLVDGGAFLDFLVAGCPPALYTYPSLRLV